MDAVEKMRLAFEHENRIRNRVVKAVASVTGISEKHLVQGDTRAALEDWVKGLKNRVREGHAELEGQVVDLGRELSQKRGELELALLKITRMRGAIERLFDVIGSHYDEIETISYADSVEEVSGEEEESPKAKSSEGPVTLEEQLLCIRDAERKVED